VRKHRIDFLKGGAGLNNQVVVDLEIDFPGNPEMVP